MSMILTVLLRLVLMPSETNAVLRKPHPPTAEPTLYSPVQKVVLAIQTKPRCVRGIIYVAFLNRCTLASKWYASALHLDVCFFAKILEQIASLEVLIRMD